MISRTRSRLAREARTVPTEHAWGAFYGVTNTAYILQAMQRKCASSTRTSSSGEHLSPMAQHGPLLIVKLQLDIHYWKDLLDFLQLNLELLESDAAPFPKERAPMIADSTAGGVGPQFEHNGYETEQGIPRQTTFRSGAYASPPIPSG